MQARDNSKLRLVVFDVEGVLMPKNRFVFDVGKSLGILQLLKMFFIGFLYEISVVTLKSALNRIFKVMQGVRIESLLEIFDKIPLTPDLENVFAQLKTRNYKTALISSGLPAVIVKKLASKLGADYAFGIEVGVNDGKLTGEIWGDVIESKGKFKVLSQILTDEGLNLKDCVVVADDRNNSPMFLSGIQKIGYNPDFVLRVKADNVVTGGLLGILPIIDGKPKQRSLPSKNTLLREAIHASGFFVPVLAGLIGIYAVALLICIVMALYVMSELSRMSRKNLPIISAITRHAASQAELYDFAAAPLYFAIGILLTLLLFPVPVSGAAIAIFALGDSTASLFGRRLSKKPLPFNKGKTLEGSIAGFFFAFLAGSLFISPAMAFIGAAVAMVIECLPLPVNDNVPIPLCTGLALMLII
ncbi:MAG: HAD-IB family phosphatase [Candidatus Bathyarchaeota archaeon]|nr:MAG: HAD-IB family phosphatase [Candidatus Bathyarchaeota archaeon]